MDMQLLRDPNEYLPQRLKVKVVLPPACFGMDGNFTVVAMYIKDVLKVAVAKRNPCDKPDVNIGLRVAVSRIAKQLIAS